MVIGNSIEGFYAPIATTSSRIGTTGTNAEVAATGKPLLCSRGLSLVTRSTTGTDPFRNSSINPNTDLGMNTRNVLTRTVASGQQHRTDEWNDSPAVVYRKVEIELAEAECISQI